jgi:hypothetical protein
MGKASESGKRVARASVSPFTRYFNRRFEDLHGHIENETRALTARVDEALAATRALQERVATDLEVVSELTLSLERFADRFGARIDEVVTTLERVLATATDEPAARESPEVRAPR